MINATLDATISALRRYEPDGHAETNANANKTIGKIITISTRSKLISITVVKDSDIQQLLPKLFSIVHYNRGDVLRIVQADESIKILFDEKNFEEIEQIIPREKIKETDKNLAEINIHQYPDAKYTPGVIAIISNDLAMNNINIIDTVSCFPEMIWIVEEKDLLNAYDVIYRSWQEFRKRYHINEKPLTKPKPISHT
jgi:aspartokinase